MAQLSGPASFLGRKLELIMCGTATDAGTANDCAKRLLNVDRMEALFAATTSASREAVLPVVKQI